jgi:hypothetical protein
MAFAGMNYLAIVAAAVAGFLFGALWYGVLGGAWLRALGKTKDELGAAGSRKFLPFVISAVCLFIMAFVLAGTIGHLGPGQVTLRNGMISGAFVWFGFVLTTTATNHAFENAKPSLTLIDAGHWLGVLLLQGAVIGWMGI